jgi:hypothetical protein
VIVIGTTSYFFRIDLLDYRLRRTDRDLVLTRATAENYTDTKFHKSKKTLF